MIYMFRKEMKKWQNFLWVVVAALALGTLSGIMFGPRSIAEVKIAKVNGYPIYFDRYRKELVSIQERINSVRQVAQMYGMSPEMLLQAYGFDDPQTMALENCVREKLYDYVKDQFGMRLDQTWFRQELVKSMPHLLDQDGRVNLNMYNEYLRRLSMTPAEFESRRAEEIKRDMLLKFMQQTAYVPAFLARESILREEAKRSFSVLTCNLDHFLAIAKKQAVDEKELHAFYLTNKEKYREPERRQANYWEFDPKAVASSMEIDAATIQHFYDKHKATLYRVAPKVRVRRLLIKSSDKKVPALASEVLQKVQANPKNFAALAKQYSEDDKTKAQGGLMDFFAKGTQDAEFEKAAFRLKNAGDVSPLVRTAHGYEILQLVERVNATEKPLEAVRDDIVKSLKAKRAMASVRADLEQLVRSAKGDMQALQEFIKRNNLTTKVTEMLGEEEAKGGDFEAALARKIFSGLKRENGLGYFAHGETYVIFRVIKIEKSQIPDFEEIKSHVREDYIVDQANILAKRALKDAHAGVLAGKKTLQEVAAQLGGSVTTTPVARTPKELKEGGLPKAIRDRLFVLANPNHVLFATHEKNFYLAKIKDMENPESTVFEAKRAVSAANEQARVGSLQAGAFIASLHRNAKIELQDKRFLDVQAEHAKEQ